MGGLALCQDRMVLSQDRAGKRGEVLEVLFEQVGDGHPRVLMQMSRDRDMAVRPGLLLINRRAHPGVEKVEPRS